MRKHRGLFWGMGFTLWVATAAFGFEVTGLSTPESIIVDPVTGHYYISNINGSPIEKDNNGFITRLDSTGAVIALKFIEGTPLHAPKGLAIIGDVLYVSDIDVVRGFHKITGQLMHLVNLKSLGALFLNDLAADIAGNLYVSDTATFIRPEAPGAIFKIETRQGHQTSVFVRETSLGQPNGLIVHPKTGRLIANTWGTGKIMEMTADGKPTVWLTHANFKDLDGLDYDRAGNLYMSSFTGGQVFRITPEKHVTRLHRDLITPADTHIDRKNNLLLVPSFQGNTVRTLSIGP